MAEHSSPIRTPQQLIVVVLLAFVVPIAAIVLLVKFVNTSPRVGAGSEAFTSEAIAARLAPVSKVTFAEVKVAGALKSGEAVYASACLACHGTGAAGAPKFGDKAAWAPRIQKGYDTLVQHAVGGFNTMPAKGGNAALDNVEVARAVVHMANEAGAKFKEPEAPAAGADAAKAAAPAAAAPAAKK